jgi:hypothetical protein
LGDGEAAAVAGGTLSPGTGPQWALLTMRPEQLSKQQRTDLRAAAGLQVCGEHVLHGRRAFACFLACVLTRADARGQTASDVGEFLEGVPPALAVAFRAQGLLRSVTLSLGLPRSSRMWRMLTARARLLPAEQPAPRAPHGVQYDGSSEAYRVALCTGSQEATIGLAYKDGAPPAGAATTARLQLRLAVVRVRFIAHVVRVSKRRYRMHALLLTPLHSQAFMAARFFALRLRHGWARLPLPLAAL